VRDEHNAIVSLPSWDWKALAVRALAATILSINLDFLRQGDFILSVPHCGVFQKQWAFASISRCAIGNSGLKKMQKIRSAGRRGKEDKSKTVDPEWWVVESGKCGG
jgi:hypothetical protein